MKKEFYDDDEYRTSMTSLGLSASEAGLLDRALNECLPGIVMHNCYFLLLRLLTRYWQFVSIKLLIIV